MSAAIIDPAHMSNEDALICSDLLTENSVHSNMGRVNHRCGRFWDFIALVFLTENITFNQLFTQYYRVYMLNIAHMGRVTNRCGRFWDFIALVFLTENVIFINFSINVAGSTCSGMLIILIYTLLFT